MSRRYIYQYHAKMKVPVPIDADRPQQQHLTFEVQTHPFDYPWIGNGENTIKHSRERYCKARHAVERSMQGYNRPAQK